MLIFICQEGSENLRVVSLLPRVVFDEEDPRNLTIDHLTIKTVRGNQPKLSVCITNKHVQ
jgi:hypothetical protein